MCYLQTFIALREKSFEKNSLNEDQNFLFLTSLKTFLITLVGKQAIFSNEYQMVRLLPNKTTTGSNKAFIAMEQNTDLMASPHTQ